MSELAQPQTEELKPHGDELESALKPSEASSSQNNMPQGQGPAPSATNPEE